MVACTFVSAPLMFISAKMISITNLKPEDYMKEYDSFSFDLAITAICAALFVLLLFTVTKKFKRLPHRITCCLLVSQLIASIGVILWSKLEQDVQWKMYLQFSFFAIGQYSSRLWAAFLAITLLFLNSRSLCFALKLWPFFLILGFGAPALITLILILTDSMNVKSNDANNPSFQFGTVQAIISVFLLVLCFIVTVGCLILHQRYKRRYERYVTLSKEVAQPDADTITTAASSTTNIERLARIDSGVNFTINNVRRRRSLSSDESDHDNKATNCTGNAKNGDCCSAAQNVTPSRVIDIEDLIAVAGNSQDTGNGLCSTQFGCPTSSREACQSLVQRYQEDSHNTLEPIEYDDNADSYQVLQHTVLLILLLCSMFVSFALTMWILIMEGISGIYIELKFLEAFLNFGQSIIVLACFISDTGELFARFILFASKVWYGADALKTPAWDDLPDETKHVCDQFATYHLEGCRKAIAKDKRWRIKVYKKVFYGTQFVEYLMEVGLARDRIEAVKYGKRLIDGRIMRHINKCHHFADKKLLYTFCNRL
jgi:Domain found in Dishevelled, Egl-10, and Pleckstrin (DEP)